MSTSLVNLYYMSLRCFLDAGHAYFNHKCFSLREPFKKNKVRAESSKQIPHFGNFQVVFIKKKENSIEKEECFL